ncbi:lasso peptide isopeptide bond-forming cyclase [Methanobacterium formicicum]|uniref:Putative asparagine synthetase [glutamine-hydrolyzing] n=1 Tax=Methanobacterium formicicum TaxID=2162 RepID=A0A843AYP6_METFO|nr:lasso peptide isopeptide bond-forming cyclase [Methanobacterium formicicum]MBF4475775.1 lasso peptide isopeptide bond-forming cyclase [Methanobacterium formicicum]
MSGITGIFRRDGRDVDPADIKKMNDKIAHRGSDGSRVWCEGPVAFGHQMLHTTQESLHEILPFEDEESGLVITADARIDNRKDLAPLLGIEDNEYVSDSYFILKSYEKWGEKCPEELLGDFAFAIWDKNKERLFCARDHMGVKPFYYHLTDDFFVFSSEIKALLSMPHVPYELNELKLAYLIALIPMMEKELTFYKNILRLSNAHYLSITLEKFFIKNYWVLDPNNIIQMDSDEEYAKTFRDIFTEAVKCRLRSSFSVGSMLSGGLDSSSIVCTAQKILENEKRTPLKTFSAIFDGVKESNERYFIEKVLKCSNYDYYYIDADKINPLGEIDSFLYFADEPLIVPNTFLTWNICREANNNGVRVLLDGFEGDATVSHGEGYLAELARTMRWKKLISELNVSKNFKLDLYYLLFSPNSLDILPKYLKKKMLRRRERKGVIGSKSFLMNKDFKEFENLSNKINEINDNLMSVNNARELHHLYFTSGMLQMELELVDWISVPFSIELRHPFFDKRLIEFCLGIPTEQKFNNGWDRISMRRAMSGILPKEIQWRRDKGILSFNFRRNLIKYEQKRLENEIMKQNNYIDQYMDMKKIQKIFNDYKLGKSTQTTHLWFAIVLSLWLRKMRFNS